MSASSGLRAALEALRDEWQADLDDGRIVTPDAGYCWRIAIREVNTVLAEHPEEES
jgi:hypothetical protein